MSFNNYWIVPPKTPDKTNREYYFYEIYDHHLFGRCDYCEIVRDYRHRAKTQCMDSIQGCDVLKARAFGGTICKECKELNEKWLDEKVEFEVVPKERRRGFSL